MHSDYPGDVDMAGDSDGGTSGNEHESAYQPAVQRGPVSDAGASSSKQKQQDVTMRDRAESIMNFSRIGVGGRKPYPFRDTPNSHPVFHTGVLIDKRTLGQGGVYARGHYSPICELYLPPPDVDRLPDSWAVAAVIDPDKFSLAVKTYNLFLPFSRLIAPKSSMNLVNTEVADKAFMIAWNFMNKAICTGKIGTQSRDLANKHMFRHPETGRVMPKMEVFCEPIVRSLGRKFLGYLERYHPGLLALYRRPRGELTEADRLFLDTEMPTAASSVAFRKELLAADNVLGVRFWILVYDKRLDMGRALQHRVWRNSVGCGDFSAMQICQRQLSIEQAWRARVENVLKVRQDGGSAAAASGAPGSDENGLDLDDQGPIVSEPQGNSVNDAEQEREEDAVLNGGPDGVEPADSRDISGGAGGGGGGATDAQKEANRRAREERREQRKREKAVAGLANALGLKSARGDSRDLGALSQTYLQKVKAERMAEYPHLYASSGSRSGPGAGRPGPRQGAQQERIGGEERQTLVGYAKEKHVAKVSITNMKQLAQIVYRQLLNLPRGINAIEGSALAEFNKALTSADDEACDLGSFEHPLHPSKWFTFSRVNELWGLSGAACTEQLDPNNYLKPSDSKFVRKMTGKNGGTYEVDFELQFPAPSCVWRLAEEEGFKTKFMNSVLPPWSFFPLQEKLEEANRRADYEEALRAQTDATSVAALAATITPAEKQFNDDERKHYKHMLNSNTWKDVMKWNKKYDNDNIFGAKATNATDSLMLAMGHESAAQKAARAAHEVEIVDRMTEVIAASRNVKALVETVCEKQPSEERTLRRYLKDHNFEHSFKPQMRPQAAGVVGGKNESAQSDIHQLHVAYLSEGGPSNPSLYIPTTGFQNLTYRGGLIAEMHLALKEIAGVTNSIHVLWAMMANGNPNAYLGSRRIGLHQMKFGPPGIGKSWIDTVYKEIKVKGTAIEVVHSTNMSKFVEQATPDRNILEDEASSKVIGDTAKAGSSQDHTALTLHKAWLSSDYITFTSFEMIDGRRVQVRKRVLARGNHYTNANIQHVVKDTSIYDRYLIFVVVPYFNATTAQMEILTKELHRTRKTLGAEWITRMQLLDRLQFGCAKMIDLGAADVCITPFVMHLLNGIPLIRRYGISNDPSLRRIPQALELATTATMTVALLETFSGSYCCTQKQPMTNAPNDTVKERPWREDFMREVRYRLFCTEDIGFYVLSQFYRQYIGDYNAWDTCHWIARVLCGYTEAYFKELFDRDAWYMKQKKRVNPLTGEEEYVEKRCQRFPFTDVELYVNKYSNRQMKTIYNEERDVEEEVPDIDQFVIDSQLAKLQWEVRGYERRGSVKFHQGRDDARDPNIASYPLFVTWRETVDGGSATEHQERISDYLSNQRSAAEGQHQVAQPAMRLGAVAAGKASQQQPHQKGGRTGAPERQRIDPNQLLVKGGFENAVKAAVSELSHAAFKHQAVDEYSLKHLMQKRVVVVPVLEEISDIREGLSFKKTIDAKGELVVVTKTVPLMEWVTFPHDLIDPYTGTPVKAGPHLVINTMAIRCFDVYLGLFEFLTAMEHKHTLEMEAPLDLTIPGFEGVLYTHKSKARNALLPKSMGITTSTAVIRTLHMERTRRRFASFTAEHVPGDKKDGASGFKILDAKDYDEALRENDKASEDIFGGMIDDPTVKSSTETFAEDRNWGEALPVGTVRAPEPLQKRSRMATTATTPSALGKGLASAQQRKGQEHIEEVHRIPAPRTHLPPSYRQESAIASYEMSGERGKEYHQEYHIFAEYKRWMYEDNGKDLVKNVHDEKGSRTKSISEKPYYPHVMDQRVEEQIQHGANFSITRIDYGGRRVCYPDELIQSLKNSEGKAERKHRKNPASYLNIPRTRCEAHRAFVLKSLEAYRNYVAHRNAQVPAVARTEEELMAEEEQQQQQQQQQPRLPTSTNHTRNDAAAAVAAPPIYNPVPVPAPAAPKAPAPRQSPTTAFMMERPRDESSEDVVFVVPRPVPGGKRARPDAAPPAPVAAPPQAPGLATSVGVRANEVTQVGVGRRGVARPAPK